MGAPSFLKFSLAFIHILLFLMISELMEARHHSLARPSSVSTPLIVLPMFHRDDPSSPLQKKLETKRQLVKGEKVAAMVNRDAARIQGIVSRVGGVTEGGMKSQNGHEKVEADMVSNARAPVSDGVADGSGEFFVTMGVGYRDFALVMDTGSDLVWLQCLPCDSCYEQTDPLFDPSLSSTFSPITCGSAACLQGDIMTCRRRFCEYQQSYGDGSFTMGSIARDNFYISDRLSSGIVMGCGHDNEGLFVGAAGLLGLGRGNLSFPTQVAEQTGGVFSYCLAMAGPGVLMFGAVSEESEEGKNRVYAPLLRNPLRELTYYYVPVVGISVGGAMVEGIAPSDFTLQMTGRGGVILDSGTTISRLVGGVYYPMRDAYRQAAGVRGYVPGGAYSIFDTCFMAPAAAGAGAGGRGGAPGGENLPSIGLHFEGGSAISLGPQNSVYFIDDELPLLCLAFAPTNNDFSILGNVQQQGFLITFDTAASRLGFLDNQCSPPPRP